MLSDDTAGDSGPELLSRDGDCPPLSANRGNGDEVANIALAGREKTVVEEYLREEFMR